MHRGERIRIAHVNFSLGIGGLETGLINLISRLPKEVFAHGVFTVKGLGPNADRALAEGARVEQVGTTEGRNRTIIWKFVQRFRAFRPHIVHTRNFGAMDAIIAARLARVPVVVHGEHGYDRDDPDGTLRKRRIIRGAISPLVSRYVTVSDELNRWLCGHRGRFSGKVQTIHNGVDLERFAPVAAHCPPPREPIVIGTVARLVPIKDQVTLVRAFGILAREWPNLRLRMVGDGPCREELETEAENAGCRDRVDFTGGTDRVEDQYRAISLFVLCSINEGISNTILEAMACGRPVVATAGGGNPELGVPGETGALCPARNPESLASAVREYLARPALLSEHGAAGRLRAVQHFSIPRMIEDYRALYMGLLRGRHPLASDGPSP
ncbi:MAG TPA: glycosyltransferase [Planctomycetota bacterium]|nr:glycosyltransferase [Planctomycetota bacterium]